MLSTYIRQALSMTEEDRLLHQRDVLLKAIHCAETHAQGWERCLDIISRTLGGAPGFRLASGTGLYDVRSAGAMSRSAYVSADYERDAGSGPLPNGMREAFAPRVGNEEALLLHGHLPRLGFYADWIRPQGQNMIMRWCLRPTSGLMDLLVLRSESVGESTMADQRSSEPLFPHLSRAIEIADRERGLESASLAALERVASAVILMDGSRRIRFANRRAESLFLVNDGVTVRNHRLTLDGIADRKLGELLAQATRRKDGHEPCSGGIFAVPRKFAPTPLSVAVFSLHESERPAHPNPLALVLITNPEDKLQVSIEGLRSLYDLTPTQARLLAALCAGESVSEVASRTGTSVTTVKTHLAAIFLKTGERRQADLVLRIARDQALLSTQ